MSKRKLANYLKNKDFAALFELGQRIAKQSGLSTSLETFNPVIVDFYQTVGFMPDAILNYLVLLGWSLDDSREEFTRDEMIKLFTLDRVNKAPASFDPAKLLAFQSRWMNCLELDQKVELCLPYLQSARLVDEQPSAELLERIKRVITAAGDRIKVSGDILDYHDFFTADDKLVFNPVDVEKRLCGDAAAVGYLKKFREALAALSSFDTPTVEKCLNEFMESEGIKFKQIVHALRVALTGKSVGFGMFDAMAILGQSSCLTRIDRALALMPTE